MGMGNSAVWGGGRGDQRCESAPCIFLAPSFSSQSSSLFGENLTLITAPFA